MERIETPREFAETLGKIRVEADIDQGYETVLEIATEKITARDAAIRAECADRAIADMVSWQDIIELKTMPPDDLANWIPTRLRAAIMGKEVVG